MPYANNKGTVQLVHLKRLISPIVVRCLDRMYNTYTCYIQNFKTVACFCSLGGWIESYLVGNLQSKFLHSLGQHTVVVFWYKKKEDTFIIP